MEEAKLTFSDYLQILKRRRTLMFVTFLSVLVLSLLIVFLLPAKYRSSALIMIEGQDIPEDLVRSTITSFADERVQRITQRAMTSINLSRIIDEVDLYDWEIDRTPRSEIVENMREDINIDLVAADVIDPRSGRPTKATIAFSIAFDYRDPVAAQKVTNKLVTLYREVNLEEGQSQVEGAADFLEDLAENHQRQVLELEAKLTELKLKNGGALPELLPTNLQLVQRLENDLTTTETRMQALKNRIILLEAQLLQTDPTMVSASNAPMTDPVQALAILESELRIARSQYGDTHPDVRQYERMVDELKRDTGATSSNNADEIERQIDEARMALETARGRYGEEHPEIVGLKRRLSNLQDAKIEAVTALIDERVRVSDTVSGQINVREGPGIDTPVVGVLRRSESATLVDGSNEEWLKIITADGMQGFVSKTLVSREIPEAAQEASSIAEGEVPTNPAYITLQANMAQAQTELQSLVTLYRNLQEKIADKQSVIERTPLVEREYSALLRDLSSARSRLEESSAKAEEARVGVLVVSGGKAQAFNLLEPPIAPTQPHWPNRWALIFLGFALSLVGTVAAAALAESVDDSIRSAGDISLMGMAPPLAMIPAIENPGDRSKSRVGTFVIIGIVLAVLSAVLLAVHLLYRPLDVLWFAVLRKLGL
ncbi:MAG: SH3 domain-containing protein [Pseudomonadota bacterium]